MENIKISIIIPTLDNVDYLKLTVRAIRNHTFYPYEILVHANTVSDKMKEYASQENFDVFTFSGQNEGVAKPVNDLVKKATGNLIFYIGDDAYLAPGWDIAFINKLNDKIFYQYLTGCMFEPQYENICMNSPISYGKTPEDFQEQKFLDEWQEKRKIKEDIISPWGPVFMTKALWDHIGGFDEGFFPGFGTDPDIVAKIYFEAIKRNTKYEFRGVADVGIYHFQCISTNKLPNSDILRAQAKARFISKWRMEPFHLHRSLRTGEKIK